MIQHITAQLPATKDIKGRVAVFELAEAVSGCINLKADVASIRIDGVAMNALGIGDIHRLSIKVAQSEGYVIADASGRVGFNPLEPGQRDESARIGLDKDKRIGE